MNNRAGFPAGAFGLRAVRQFNHAREQFSELSALLYSANPATNLQKPANPVLSLVKTILMPEKPIRIALIDDHKMWLEALTALLSGVEEVEVVGVAAGGREGLELCLREQPSQVLLDLRMPDMDGMEVLERLLGRQPDAKVIFLTERDDPSFIMEGLAKGIKGYVLKGSSKEDLTRAFREVEAGHYFFDPQVLTRLVLLLLERPQVALGTSGDCPLTPREKEVLALIAEGKSTAEIAEMLCIAINTVDSHRKNIFSKLDAKNAVEAVNKGRELHCI